MKKVPTPTMLKLKLSDRRKRVVWFLAANKCLNSGYKNDATCIIWKYQSLWLIIQLFFFSWNVNHFAPQDFYLYLKKFRLVSGYKMRLEGSSDQGSSKQALVFLSERRKNFPSPTFFPISSFQDLSPRSRALTSSANYHFNSIPS